MNRIPAQVSKRGSGRWAVQASGIGKPWFRGARAEFRECEDDAGVLGTGDRDEPDSGPGGVENLTTVCDR